MAARRPAPPAARGFTLVEVLVAVSITAGALLLLLSAGHSALRRSQQAHESTRLDRAAESVLSEWLIKPEGAPQGELPGGAGRRWAVRTEAVQGQGVRGLERVVLRVEAPGQRARELVVYRYREQPPNG